MSSEKLQSVIFFLEKITSKIPPHAKNAEKYCLRYCIFRQTIVYYVCKVKIKWMCHNKDLFSVCLAETVQFLCFLPLSGWWKTAEVYKDKTDIKDCRNAECPQIAFVEPGMAFP